MIELRLPYPISANRYWATRVVTPRDGKPFVNTYVTPEAKEFKEAVGWIARAAGARQPMQGRIAIEFTLHPKLPQDWKTRMRRDPAGWPDTVQCMDLDNANKVLLDALKGIVFEDDSWVRQILAKRGEPRPDGELVVAVRPWVDETQPSLLEAL